MAKLTRRQKMRVVNAFRPHIKHKLREHLRQRGSGFFSSLGKVLGPIAKEVGGKILKDVLLPMGKAKIQAKMQPYLRGRGRGRVPRRYGRGLKLSGRH